MTTAANLTRRAALSGTAALPALALPGLASAATDNPAIAAVRRWVAADEAERNYCSSGDLEDDPAVAVLETETSRCHWQMAQTAPTTAEGLALLRVALTFDQASYRAGARIEDPATWGDDAGKWFDGRDDALVRTAMSSPVAVELVWRIVS